MQLKPFWLAQVGCFDRRHFLFEPEAPKLSFISSSAVMEVRVVMRSLPATTGESVL